LAKGNYKSVSVVPKAGVVGLVPQFKKCMRVIVGMCYLPYSPLNSGFLPVKKKWDALIRFFAIVCWDRNYNQDNAACLANSD
jgi:hypothetical protein